MSEVARLHAEVIRLQEVITSLSVRVQALEEAREADRSAPVLHLSGQSAPSFSERPAGSPVASASASNPAPATSPVSPRDIPGRQALARQVGTFLRQALGGTVGPTSGRDRLRLKSRVYVVLAGFDGQPLPRPSVFQTFAPVARICKEGSFCGRSIFAGFATSWEARVALEEAGFPWSSEYE